MKKIVYWSEDDWLRDLHGFAIGAITSHVQYEYTGICIAYCYLPGCVEVKRYHNIQSAKDYVENKLRSLGYKILDEKCKNML